MDNKYIEIISRIELIWKNRKTNLESTMLWLVKYKTISKRKYYNIIGNLTRLVIYHMIYLENCLNIFTYLKS